MKLLILSAFLVIITSVHCRKFTGELGSEVKKVAGGCIDQAGVSLDEVKKLQTDGYDMGEPTKNMMCYTKCMLQGLGAMKEEALDKEAITEKFGPQVGKDNIKRIIANCENEAGEGICETPYRMFMCFKKEMGATI